MKSKSLRIVLVSRAFEKQFIEQSEEANLSAIRESTKDERNEWIKNRVERGENMMDCAGESVIPPNIKWVDLLGKLIAVENVRCKVPFNNANYRPFKNYGSIIVYDENLSYMNYYMPSDEIKVLQKLISMPEHFAPNGVCYGEIPKGIMTK